MHYRVTTMNLMESLGREEAYICLGEILGDKCQEYILTIAIDEPMKIGSDSNEPIHSSHFFNRNITLHIINKFTPKRCQPI